MVTYLPRSAWRARPPNGSRALVGSRIDGDVIHWPGMAQPINASGATGQARIASALRGWQNYHMDDRGWSDIAYQVAVDQAGRAWTLRGNNIQSAANGNQDVNERFGAVLLIVAPGETPTAAAVATVKGVLADFKRLYPGSRNKPYGHRDVRPAGTDCPGDITYGMIQAGTFTIGAPVPGDDDMQLTDIIPGLEDENGNPVTVGQALARGQKAYEYVTEGGAIDKRLDIVEGRVTSNTDARAQYAYAAVIEGGTVDQRLDALENPAPLT